MTTLGEVLAAADRFFERPAIYRRKNVPGEIPIRVAQGDDVVVFYNGEVPQAVRRAVFSCDLAALTNGGSFMPESGDELNVGVNRYRITEGAEGICSKEKWTGFQSGRIEFYAEKCP